MPTTVVKTIRASGGDYTTLSAWEAANQGNLVSADEVRVAECYNDWPSGLADTVDVSGSTTDATRYMMITVAPGHRHNGTPRSGFYAKSAANWQTGFAATDAYCVFEWLDFSATHTGTSSFKGPATSARVFTLRRCIGTNGAGNMDIGSYQQLGNGTTVIACLAVGGVYGFVSTNWASGYFYNCVAANCQKGYGWIGGTGAPIYKNCVAYNCSTYAYKGGSASSASNASSASSGAPGSGAVYSITSAAFADAANNDFHLAPGSALIGAGANLYADFQTDIDGDAWPSSGAWDIGFDRYVASVDAIAPGSGIIQWHGDAPIVLHAIRPVTASVAWTGYAPAVSQQTVFAEEDFAGSGPTTLTNPPWTKTALIGVGNLSILSGMLRGLGAGITSALYAHNNAAPSPDYTVSLDIQAGAANLGGSTVSVVGRYTGEMFYIARYAGTSGRYEIQKFELFGGGLTTLGTYAASISSGATVTLGLRMIGDQIALLADDVAVIEVTDTTVTAAGQAGVQAYTGASTDWYGDNFQAALVSSVSAIAPSAGAVACTGQVPGVFQPRAVQPAAGAFAWAGSAPGLVQPQAVSPSAGAAQWAGGVPGIVSGRAVAPAAGAVAWEGYAPAVAQSNGVAPTAGTAVWSGSVPGVVSGRAIAPAAGAVAWAGEAPGIAQPRTVAPSAGVVVWAGGAPAVGLAKLVEPADGGIVWQGSLPGIAQPRTVSPGTGTAVWTGSAPGVEAGRAVRPAGGAARCAGHAPGIGQPRAVAPGAGAVRWLGNAPYVGAINLVRPDPGAIVFAGRVPGMAQPRTVSPLPGAARWAGGMPGIGDLLGRPEAVRAVIRERFILTVAAERRILRS